jgi:multidrug efflux pump subunit AcrA (membrane-fusion protein)
MKRTRTSLLDHCPVVLGAMILLFGIVIGCGGEQDGHDDGAHAPHGEAAPGASDQSPHADEHEGDEADEHEGDEADEHEGHEADEHEGHEADEHDGQEDDGHEGHEAEHGGEEKIRVELTAKQRERTRLEVAVAGPGEITTDTVFPGELILDPDRIVHVVPRAAGIVREVTKTLGDRVTEGEILAWIESDELAEAKLAFYDAEAEVACSMITLPRAEKIFENTTKLLALLKREATQQEIRELDGLEMGGYRGRLLTSYAEYLAARETHEREKGLRDKAITSGRELLEAETAYKKTREEFRAAMDMVRYETLIGFTEATKDRMVAEFLAAAAERRLRLKGADDEVVAGLRRLVPRVGGENEIPSIREALAKDGQFASYAVRAPFAGYVIEKHLTLGEKATGEESVFSIADTTSVWARFNVFQKDLAAVKPGQKATVDLGAGLGSRKGTIGYVSPQVDEATRTVQARIVLDNADGTSRPGLYVTVHVATEPQSAPVVVPKTSGLRPGQRYVARGAFDLKAIIATSSLGGHAGHGH